MASHTTKRPAPPTDARLLITLSGVARLARVQRPVVSVWRRRHIASDAPFPSPVAIDRGQERFDAIEVAAWLVTTGRGNNPDAVADAAVFARLDSAVPGDEKVFEVTTALIALRSAAGRRLGQLDRAAMLDLADEVDPDDSFLFSEVDAQEGIGALAHFVDALVDGAYDTGAAFEAVMEERFRDGHRQLIRSALKPAATALVQSVALELAHANPASDPSYPVFADPTGASGDLMIGIAAGAPEYLNVTMLTAETNDTDDGGSLARLLRRRLLAHGVPGVVIAVRDDEFAVDGPVVHIAQLPASAAALPAQALSSIDALSLHMDDTQRAIILGPASVLCDSELPDAAATIRSDILRSGRVRAIIRLPRGLVTANPSQGLALWVLGPSYRHVALADRWTMLADLTEVDLSPDVRRDLVSDVVAAMGDRNSIRAHAFRFARFTLTSVLLARTGSLLGDGSARPMPRPGGQQSAATLAARVDQLIAALGDGCPIGAVSVNPGTAARLGDVTIGALLNEGRLRYLPGTRLDPEELGAGPGFTVIGDVELAGAPVGGRTADRLAFAAVHPNARLTEPGDVIFISGTQPRALVDIEGSAIVAYPARILRIDRANSAGVIAEVLAADIREAATREWRSWPVRRTAPQQREPLQAALANIRTARADAELRVANLIELEQLVTDAVTRGAVSLTKGTN